MKPLSHSFLAAAIALLGLSAAAPATAQTTGKTGTTIRLDGKTCSPLYSSGAGTTDKKKQFFSFLRHNISHVQLVLSNYPTLHANGSGNFATNANNMLFENEKLALYNWQSYSQFVYFAIVAPKGYRFTRYQMDVDGDKSTAGTYVSRYTYGTDGTPQYLADSITVSKGMSAWDVSMGNGTNVLYFRYNMKDKSKRLALYLNSIKLTYSIDQPFTTTLPGGDASTNIHTGILDPGTFSYSTAHPTVWAFDQDNGITDTQLANLYLGSTKITPQTATTNGSSYFVATKDGDYYVEAPEKFRVIGATLKFLRADVTADVETTVKDVTSITSGKQYVITDGNGHYLTRSGSSITVTDNPAKATQWTITGKGSYTITDGGYSLVVSRSWGVYSLGLSKTSSSTWTWNGNKGFCSSSYSSYYLTYSSNAGWTVATSPSNYANPKTITTTNASAVVAGDFTATAYTRDGQQLEAQKLTENEADATIELNDFNNDAIHFSISGLPEGCGALYTVDLKLLPLNPELQRMSVASRFDDNTLSSTTSFTAENYEFNGNESVQVLVPSGKTECTVEFKDAYNENRTKWYTDGSNDNSVDSEGGYSNYFIVSSTADKGGANDVTLDITKTSYAEARVNATKAGTVGLPFTNIKEIYGEENGNFTAGASRLVDNDFDKKKANYSEATVSTTACKLYYIYVADQPTWRTLPADVDSKHIDFRYFTLNVCAKAQQEEADVTVTPIYTSTLKNKSHKEGGLPSDGSTLDKAHTYYGITVKAKLDNNVIKGGSLTSNQILDGIKAALKEKNYYGFGEEDYLRGALYIDLSSLEAAANDQFNEQFDNSTADNCLYFVNKNFLFNGVGNVVAKDDKTFTAVSNVTVYDQQPFFTPYDFYTGTHTVSYERESTNGKAKVKQMAVVLPFDVQLDGTGKLKSASDATDDNITYHNITKSGELKEADPSDDRHMLYAVVAEAVSEGTAEANKPYYVTTKEEGFTYHILGAQFRTTPAPTTTGDKQVEELTNTHDTWTAHGTYAGTIEPKADDLWYFSKNYFWKSGALTAYNVVNILPFRSYYTTTDKTTYSQAGWTTNEGDITPTGINDINAAKGNLLVAAGHGFITLTATENVPVRVYTVAGQLVANYDLFAGETRRADVAQGIYLVNGVKVVVR